MLRLHILDPRLKQLKPEPPIRGKHGRNPQIKLRIRQIQPRALPRAFTESKQISLQAWVFEKAFWSEGARIWEQGRIIVDEDRGHADGGHWRDAVLLVLGHVIGEETLEALGDAVADAETFGDDGGEVGELFELLPFGWRGGIFHQWRKL